MGLSDLPSEILLQILAYLPPHELVPVQSASRRFLTLSRDPELWKGLCYEASHAERRRKHQSDLRSREHEVGRDERYGPLLRAMLGMVDPVAPGTGAPPSSHDPLGAAESTAQENERERQELEARRKREERQQRAKEKKRIMANWDPTYPGERIDWYEEYVQRKGDVVVSWFEGIGDDHQDRRRGPRDEDDSEAGDQEQGMVSLGSREVTGVGMLYAEDGAVADKAVAALDDGSVCIWELEEGSVRRGGIIARSRPGLLTGSKEPFDLDRTNAAMTETGAVECVSIDSVAAKAYFGILNELVEVDLRTLQVTSRHEYPFPVTAISEAKGGIPVTVGTNWTVHIHDQRDSFGKKPETDAGRSVQLIGGLGAPSLPHGSSHATLAQPGPLSLLHLPAEGGLGGSGDNEIWLSGRFTSLLNYDRRAFPRLKGHIHSGARISCLRSTPHPLIPRDASPLSSTPALALGGLHARSASAIAALKAVPGTTLLAAGEYKGKGSLELYGLSSANQTSPSVPLAASTPSAKFLNRQTASSSKLLTLTPHGGKICYADGDGNVRWVERDGFSPIRSWNLNGAERGTRDPSQPVSVFSAYANTSDATASVEPIDDIVQLLLPTRPHSTSSSSPAPRFGEDNLVFWTGEGKIGLLGFGKHPKWDHEAFFDALEEQAEAAEEKSKREEERSYDQEMGVALRAHANELNFLQRFGFGAG